MAAILPEGRISPCSAPRKNNSSRMAGTTHRLIKFTASAAPPAGRETAAPSRPSKCPSSPPNRLPAFATPKNRIVQKAGLQGAGSSKRRSSVRSRVSRNNMRMGSKIAATLATIASSSASTGEKPTGFERLAPSTRRPIKNETPACSRLRAARYPMAASAQQEAAPFTPRIFPIRCNLHFSIPGGISRPSIHLSGKPGGCGPVADSFLYI